MGKSGGRKLGSGMSGPGVIGVARAKRPAQPSGSVLGSQGLANELRHAIEGEVIPRLLLAYHDELRTGGDNLLSQQRLTRRHPGNAAADTGRSATTGRRDANGRATRGDQDAVGASAVNGAEHAQSGSKARSSMPCEASWEPSLQAVAAMPEPQVARSGGALIHHSEVVAFADLLIDHDPQVAFSVIMAHVRQGFSMSALLLDLCAPAARELGDRWLRDECSFCDVTVGLSSLEQVLMRCSDGMATPVFDAGLRGGTCDKTALFTSLPGNQHTFGLMIVKELFRRAGWIVHDPAGPDRQGILDMVRCTHFSLLGLSISTSKDLHTCQSLVKACKTESLNPKLLVVVGGYGIQETDVTESMIGADVIARDGDEALMKLERLVAAQQSRGPLN